MRFLRCKLCGATTNLHKHHIIPLSEGGFKDFRNRMIVCQDCHGKLHERELRNLILSAPAKNSIGVTFLGSSPKKFLMGIRFSPEEFEAIQKKLDEQGLTFADLARKVILEACDKKGIIFPENVEKYFLKIGISHIIDILPDHELSQQLEKILGQIK